MIKFSKDDLSVLLWIIKMIVLDFFQRNWKTMLLIVFMISTYVWYNKYQYEYKKESSHCSKLFQTLDDDLTSARVAEINGDSTTAKSLRAKAKLIEDECFPEYVPHH